MKLKNILATAEREAIDAALDRTYGDLPKASRKLGVSQSTLRRKCREHGLLLDNYARKPTIEELLRRRHPGGLRDAVMKLEKELVSDALRRYGTSRQAARALQTNVSRISRRVSEFELDVEALRRSRRHVPRKFPNLHREIEKLERSWIGRALNTTDGDMRAAAKLLRVPRSQLYRKVAKLGIEVDRYR